MLKELIILNYTTFYGEAIIWFQLNAFVVGCKSGNRGRGVDGTKQVIFAVRQQENSLDFMVACVVKRVNAKQLREFRRRFLLSLEVLTGAFLTLCVLDESGRYEHKAISIERVDKLLSTVHIVINKFRSYLLGTFHGILHQYLSEYIDENVFCFNRRFRAPQLPDRLLQIIVDRVPILASHIYI